METKRLNITEGEWVEYKEGNGELWIKSDETLICAICADDYRDASNIKHSDETRANSSLIIDAGTTYNKCGLLPSDLLKQRDELLVALKTLLREASQNSFIMNGSLNDTKAEGQAIQAIQNAQNK